MATKPTHKLEALLKVLATRPMNNTEIKRWLSSRSGGKNTFPFEQDKWNFSLYGTNRQVGVLERFCRKNSDGRWQTIRKVEAPYTPVRYGLNDDGTAVQIAYERRFSY